MRSLDVALFGGNLASNCMARVLVLGEALALQHRVKIVGPAFGGDVWSPAADSALPIEAFKGGPMPRFALTAWRAQRRIDADVIVACKPLLASFGAALAVRLRKGTPVILDIDDDELALTAVGASASLVSRIKDPTGNLYTRLAGSMQRRADGHFSVMEAYQRQYGGVVVPHGRDVRVWDPARYDREAVRRKLGFNDRERVVGFVGTPRPHKGVDQILAAVKTLGRPDVRVLVVGVEDDDAYVRDLQRAYPDALRTIGLRPYVEMPYYLAAIDVVALPQQNTPEGRGQVPAKLFDAMAMGKAIVASSVGGIPEHLGDAGLLVPPGDAGELAAAIGRLLDDRNLARALGERARRRCIERYSYEAMLDSMNDEITRALGKRHHGDRVRNESPT